MTTNRKGQHETDKRFPSGIWVGYWMQGYIKGRMRLTLEFINGAMTGEGTDSVGSFDVKGIYSTTKDLVVFSKRYHGAHSVGYAGCSGNGGLHGTWHIKKIPQIDEWRIWPIHDETEHEHFTAAAEDVPVVLVGEIANVEEPINVK